MELFDRRALITVTENPDPGVDYVVAIAGRLDHADGTKKASIGVRYVPDRLIVEPAGLEAYLAALADQDWPNLESVSVLILDDMRNELVPQWLQIQVMTTEAAMPHVERHAIVLEDRQPGWGNDELLARMPGSETL